MTNTIPNVPRELLERAIHSLAVGMFDGDKQTASELRALLSAPSPAGVDGWVRNFKTREGYDVWDKLCAIPKFGFLIGPSGGVVKVADIGNWIDRDEAQSVVDEAQCEVNLLRHEASAAQAIIDGLRVDNEALRKRAKIAEREAMSALRTYKGLEKVARVVSDNSDRVCGELNVTRQQRDKLADILRDLVPGCKWQFMRPRIDAALAEIDHGNE